MTCLVKFIAFSCVLTAFSFSAKAQDAAYDSVIDQISKATLSAKEGGYTVVKTVWIEKIEKAMSHVSPAALQKERGVSLRRDVTKTASTCV